MRILIADDHALFRDGLRSLLEANDLEVVGEASNGKEAIELAWKHKPDVVLMDLGMPEMDGLEATRQIRAMASHVPIIALTAYAMPEDREAMLAAGMDDCVVKPITRDRLRDALERALSTSPVAATRIPATQ